MATNIDGNSINVAGDEPFYVKAVNKNNCNEMSEAGIYQAYNASNAPVTGWITVVTFPIGNSNTDYSKQICFALNSNNIYTRYRQGGSWQSWVTLHS